MDRTEASVVPARDGGPIRHAPAARRSWRGLARVGLVSCVVATGAWASVAGAQPVAAAPSARSADSVTLAAQSPAWIGPDPAHQVLSLTLHISSSAARRELGLQVTVYHHLGSRFQLNETLSGRGLGAAATRSPTLTVSSLPTDAQGDVHMTIPVVGDATPTSAGSWTADLGCPPGACGGVYPVKVTLADPTAPSATSATLVTYLIYDNPAAHGQPLRVALVVPAGMPVAPAGQAGRVPGPQSTAVGHLDGLVAAIANAGDVPLTLAPDPSTLGTLIASGHQRVASALASLSSSSARQTLAQSFVPVDPTALVDAGLAGELSEQIHRAAQVLDSVSPDVRATRGTWVATGTLDAAALGALAPDFSHVVVPPSALAGPPSSLTTTQPFTITGSGSSGSSGSGSSGSGSSGSASRGVSLTGAVSDPALGAHLAAGAGTDPALAAVQFLADASLVYYELPNLSAPRAVVGAAPAAWAPDPSFLAAVLTGLQGNPVLAPVTIEQLFQQVAIGADGQATQRRPAVASTGAASVPARSIRPARTRLQAFSSAVSSTAPGAAAAQGLDDLLLTAESNELSSRQQQSAVVGFSAALDAQLHQLSVRSDTVRLTSGAASVPITVLRNAPYAVTAVVRVTSDKVVFPRGTPATDALCKSPMVTSSAGRSSFSALCVLDHGTTAVYVDMRSRAAGDFRIDVTLTCPQGDLVLASGHLTARVMSTSAVAIALSAAAAFVLLGWWGRTLWRGRRAGRGTHRRATTQTQTKTPSTT